MCLLFGLDTLENDIPRQAQKPEKGKNTCMIVFAITESNDKREVRVHWPEQDTWEPASEFPKEVDRVMMRRARMNTMFGATKGKNKGRRNIREA